MYLLILVVVFGVETQNPDIKGGVGQTVYMSEESCKNSFKQASKTFLQQRKGRDAVLIGACNRINKIPTHMKAEM